VIIKVYFHYFVKPGFTVKDVGQCSLPLWLDFRLRQSQSTRSESAWRVNRGNLLDTTVSALVGVLLSGAGPRRAFRLTILYRAVRRKSIYNDFS
jgi:hypothetical protein